MKNGIKKSIAFIMAMLVFSMLFNSGITFAASTPQTVPDGQPKLLDIRGHWSENEINNAVKAGFVQGYADGTFQPNGVITRAEFVSMVNRALQLKDENVLNLTFTDIEETDWYYKDIRKASYARYVSGVSDTQFLPNKALTREEAAMMLARFLPKAGYLTEHFPETYPSSLTRAEAVKIIGSILEKETIFRANMFLSRAGDILNDAIIIGDLVIEAPSGIGEVVLQNSSALSKVSVLGNGNGGVILRDANIPQLILTRNGSNVSVVTDGESKIYVSYAFNGNHLVDTNGQRLRPGVSELENEIQLNGLISDEDALRIINEIALRFFSGVKILEEAVREGVQAIKPKSSITTDEHGTIIASVPAPPQKRVRPFVPVSGISVAPPVIISGIGSHPVMIPSVSPSNATNKNVVWSSSDESIATVQNGVLTLHKMGTATISAITIDGGKAADTFVSVPTQAEARAFWSFNEVMDSVKRSLDSINLMEEAHLSWAEGLFLAENGHMQRISRNLPFVPGREEFLEYYLSPVVNRIVAAREAFDEIQLSQVKKSIEEAVYTMSQSAVIDEASVKASIERKLTELALTGIATEVTKMDYLPAVAGYEAAPDGVNGAYIFTVAMTKVMEYLTVEGTTTPLTMTILATPHSER